MPSAEAPILLSTSTAQRCAMRVHHDHSPMTPAVPEVILPAELQARIDRGKGFAAEMVTLLAELHPATTIDTSLSWREQISATVAAMDAGAGLILHGRLPDDLEGGRRGGPDLLIRVEDGYLPGVIRAHASLAQAKTTAVEVSTLEDITTRFLVKGWHTPSSYRLGDGMRLAHFSRMLAACGRLSEHDKGRGLVLGTSRLPITPAGPAGALSDAGPGLQQVFVWYDLEAALFSTFSRSRGKVKRSTLERYDHEHSFRVKVAANASRIEGRLDDPEPLVTPIGQAECSGCPYQELCTLQMGSDDPSAHLTVGQLDLREWRALRKLDVSTTTALADLDPADEGFLELYTPEVSHLTPKTAASHLASAVTRAGMIRDGVGYRRLTSGPMHLPSGTVEIDLDVETDPSGRVYLWGVRVSRPGLRAATAVQPSAAAAQPPAPPAEHSGGDADRDAAYVDRFIDWTPMDLQRQHLLASRFVAWLRDQRAQVEAAGGRLRVFHWSSVEASKLRNILGEAEVADLLEPQGGDEHPTLVDLRKIFDTHFFPLHGSSIKAVAPLFGFHWTSPDAGGDPSMLYLEEVHSGRDPHEVAAAKAWLVGYNHEDNDATAAVRGALRELDGVDGANAG